MTQEPLLAELPSGTPVLVGRVTIRQRFCFNRVMANSTLRLRERGEATKWVKVAAALFSDPNGKTPLAQNLE